MLLLITFLTSTVLGLGAIQIVRRHRHEPAQKRVRVFVLTMVVLISAVAVMGWLLSRPVVLRTLGVS